MVFIVVIVRSDCRDRISNRTNLFWQEPNWTRHRIFAFVSLLFCNL